MGKMWCRSAPLSEEPALLSRVRQFQSRCLKMQGQLFSEQNVNPDLEYRVNKVSDKFSENLHVIANEPSLAFFRIQEHTRKSLPQLVERKHEFQDVNRQVQGTCFDTEYAINTVQQMEKSSSHFQNIQDLLKNSMFLKQQIQYEQSRRAQEQSKPSMYRGGVGSMLRTQTVDIPAGYVAEVEARRQDFTHSMQLPISSSRDSPHGSPRVRSSSLSGPRSTTPKPEPSKK